MDADEARKISKAHLNGAIIEPLLRTAYARIEKWAKKGKFSVPHPFYGADVPAGYNPAAQEAAARALRGKGFTVKLIQNFDPGDPRSSDYWEVSW